MKQCASVLVVVMAAVWLFGAGALNREYAAAVSSCAAEDDGRCLLILKDTPVALPQEEGKQNPWIRLDGGEGQWMEHSGPADPHPGYVRT